MVLVGFCYDGVCGLWVAAVVASVVVLILGWLESRDDACESEMSATSERERKKKSDNK